MKLRESYYEELLGRAYGHLRLSSLAIMVNAIVVAGIFYSYVNDNWLFFWLVGVLAINSFRFVSSIVYAQKQEKFSLEQWRLLFYIPLILSSVLWGFASFFFFIPESYPHQAMLIVVIAGLSAGAISSLSSIPRGVEIFIFSIITPLVIQLFMQESAIHTTMAILVIFFLVLMYRIAGQFNEHYLDIIKSRQMYENEKEKLVCSEERFEKIFKQAPLGIIIYDENLIIRQANQELVDFLEAPHDFLIGLDLYSLPDSRILPSIEAPLSDTEGFYEGEYATKYKQKNMWISMSTAPLKDVNHNIIGGIGIVSDITQRMTTQLMYEYQASHDQLTNIPNRTTLLEKIKYEIIRYKRHDTIFGLIFLDLDNFKNINDSLGHAVGDKLLVETATRLKEIIREEDTVARIGGDEFVILLPDLGVDEHKSATNAEHIAQKVHAVLKKQFVIEGFKLNISSSIGITMIDNKGYDENDLLKHADIAMYQAKKAGKNTTTFYKHQMDEWVKRRLTIENGLRNAIENAELELYYQPIIEFSTGRLVGAEALLRWNSQEFTDVFPDEFIPIAEESGLIVGIGAWVLENSVKQFAAWKKEFGHIESFQKIAVNISVNQFNYSGFLGQVKNILTQTGINPHNLELELVESIIVNDVELVRKKMHELRNLGVKLSIDDFGTGYSSLAYLKKLPFTTLKIDKSFVQDIQDDIDDKELISTILTIAKNFNLEVVAEGVETYEQYTFLQEKICDYMQGYYCSRPLNVKNFEVFFTSNGGFCQVIAKSELKH